MKINGKYLIVKCVILILTSDSAIARSHFVLDHEHLLAGAYDTNAVRYDTSGSGSMNKNVMKNKNVMAPNGVCYVETFGTAVSWLAVYFEYTFFRFRQEQWIGGFSHSFRISAGTTMIPIERYYIPVSVRYLMFDSDHHIEIGAGVNMLVADTPRPAYEEDMTGFSHSLVLPVGILGYRYENRDGLFVFRLAGTLFFDYEAHETFEQVGVSVGFTL